MSLLFLFPVVLQPRVAENRTAADVTARWCITPLNGHFGAGSGETAFAAIHSVSTAVFELLFLMNNGLREGCLPAGCAVTTRTRNNEKVSSDAAGRRTSLNTPSGTAQNNRLWKRLRAELSLTEALPWMSWGDVGPRA